MFGPIGGLVGFFLGSLFDGGSFIQIDDGTQPPYGGSYGGNAGGYTREQQRTGQRNSFLMSLLVL
ncbi:MAG: molecular chaperone DjlA, partial [Bacteroidales bacterium]|nr:molecular chaperone DjlA [Bacteroidales bacterium]